MSILKKKNYCKIFRLKKRLLRPALILQVVSIDFEVVQKKNVHVGTK